MLALACTKDSDAKQVLSSTIEELGYELLCVNSYTEVIDLLAEKQQNKKIAEVKAVFLDFDNHRNWLTSSGKIKNKLSGHATPIIYLSSKLSDSLIIQFLIYGDTYIEKPLKADLLASKLRVHGRAHEAFTRLDSINKELIKYKNVINAERKVVEQVFATQTVKNICNSDSLRYHISPVSVFNGDVLLASKGPSGSLYVMVGDVTGHGLAAAVSAVPVYPTFRAMAEKGFSVGTIAYEMNRALSNLMPSHMLMAATLIEMDSSGRRVNVWSGGMPALIHENGRGAIIEVLQSQHAPLAALSEQEFSQSVSVLNTELGDRLYLFTDGIEESRDFNGDMFGEKRLHDLFDGKETSLFERIIQELVYFSHGTEQDDDITLVELFCVEQEFDEPVVEVETDNSQIRLIPWSLSFHLTDEQLKQKNPLFQVFSILKKAIGLNVHQDYLSTILSEYFNNALDHGLLKLDSKMKLDVDGFFEYYSQRKTRLAELQGGIIDIAINFTPMDSKNKLQLRVTDNGDGYDYEQFQREKERDAGFNRGLALVEELADAVEISDGGRTVTVVCFLEKSG